MLDGYVTCVRVGFVSCLLYVDPVLRKLIIVQNMWQSS